MRGLVLALLLACGAGARVSEGESALERGDVLAAEVAFRKALEARPDDARALYGLGWALHLAGERDLARESFQRLAVTHPGDPLGWRGLGSVALGEGNTAVARARFAEALRRAPGDVAVRHSLALLELGAGRPTDALTQLDALAAEAPGRAEIHLARAEALVRLDREAEALTAVDRARDSAGSPRARAQALVLRARVLLATSAGRVRGDDCPGTVPAVTAWLDAADAALDEADATGARVPELVEVRRTVRAQRGTLQDTCPGGG